MPYPAGNSHQKMVKYGHKGMDEVSNNTQEGCGNTMMLNWDVKYQPSPSLQLSIVDQPV